MSAASKLFGTIVAVIVLAVLGTALVNNQLLAQEKVTNITHSITEQNNQIHQLMEYDY
jgi:hypothetical protein